MLSPAEVLEHSQWDTFWVPPDVTVYDRPDYLLLSCPRPSGYLNTVLRATGNLDAHLEETRHLQQGRKTRWMLTDTHPMPPTQHRLTQEGWSPHAAHEVRILEVDAWKEPPSTLAEPVTTRAQLRDAMSVSARAFGAPDTTTEAQLDVDLYACTVGTRVRRVVAYLDGQPAGSAGLTLFPRLGFGLLWAGSVVEEARGKGIYRAMIGARVAIAQQHGISRVGLYAKNDTSAPIVTRLGFAYGGQMELWESP